MPTSTPAVREFPNERVSDILRWFASQEEPSSNPQARIERARVRAIFENDFGELRLAELRAHHLIGWIKSKRSLESPFSRRRWVSCIVKPFNEALRQGFIGFNPFAGVSKFFKQGKDGRDLTHDEFERMWQAATPSFKQVLYFLRYTGSRPGEMGRICPEHVFLDNNFIVLLKHKTDRTGKPRRIFFNDQVKELLEKLLIGRKEGEPIFRNEFGRVWSTQALSKNIQRLRKRLKLPDDARLYGCRHLFATDCIVQGLSLSHVQQLLSHQFVATTERYIHLSNGKNDVLLDAVKRATAGLPDFEQAAERPNAGRPVSGRPGKKPGKSEKGARP
ncbi:MAG TPA: tyrosine-type recombinase/integrase [Gemmataceae bacterium]|nr:tyrosine-type recombinase/integrase [Gemmataceae bacterium]